MSGEITTLDAPEAESFDLTSAFFDLKFRKKGALVELKKADEGVPVYVIHELMGDVSFYHKIVEEIESPVFGIQVPRRERCSGAIPTIDELSEKYVQLIVRNQPEGQIRLVGWSAGAIIALEVARKLTAIGRQPQILVNIDQALDNAKGIVGPYHSFLENLYYWLRNEQKWPLWKFGGRLMEKFTETVMALTGRRPSDPVHDPKTALSKARTPEEGEFIKEFYELLFAYIPPRSYAGRVLSFIASENEDPIRLIRSWKSVARNSTFIFVPGDHDTVIKGRGAIQVRGHIRKAFSELPTAPMPTTPAKARP